MPLADDGCFISGLLKVLRQVRLRAIEAIKHGDAILMTVFSCQNCRAAGRADGIIHEASRQHHAFARQSIYVWRPIDPAAIRADRMRRVVVRHDEENVRARGGCSTRRSGQDGKQCDRNAEGSPEL